jgi:hypothetical protein
VSTVVTAGQQDPAMWEAHVIRKACDEARLAGADGVSRSIVSGPQAGRPGVFDA